jgi:hypothetical protein
MSPSKAQRFSASPTIGSSALNSNNLARFPLAAHFINALTSVTSSSSGFTSLDGFCSRESGVVGASGVASGQLNVVAIEAVAADTAVNINASANAQIVANDKEAAEQRKAVNEATFNAIIGFASTTLSALEGLAGENEKAQKAIEISRILTSATSNAFQAFAQATATIPPPAGQIVGVALAGIIGAGAAKAIANAENNDFYQNQLDAPTQAETIEKTKYITIQKN